MEATTLEILDVIGTWVAAIGTVGAVITSLWMSYNSNKVKLIASANSSYLIRESEKKPIAVCEIDITNIGSKTLIVNSIGWEVGRFKKRKYYQSLKGTLSDKTPKTLLESEEAIFAIEFYGKGDWLKGMAKTANEVNINTLKLIIATSVGQTFKIKASTSLINDIKEMQKKSKV